MQRQLYCYIERHEVDTLAVDGCAVTFGNWYSQEGTGRGRSTVKVYTELIEVDRLGSGIWVSASFQFFALTARSNVQVGNISHRSSRRVEVKKSFKIRRNIPAACIACEAVFRSINQRTRDHNRIGVMSNCRQGDIVSAVGVVHLLVLPDSVLRFRSLA